MNNDYIAILDIGTTKIVALVGKKDESGKLKIVGYGEEKSAGVNRGLVLNVNEASVVIQRVVQTAREQSNVDFDEVYVGIAGQHITSTQTTHSVINKDGGIIEQSLVNKMIKDVYNLSLNPGEIILHVFPQEYKVDDATVINPVGTMGKQLIGRFHISVGKEDKINILKTSVEKAGLKIKHIILEPVASSIAVLSDEEKEAGVALLDIGGGTSDLIIYKDKLVRYTAVIPFGGNSITNDIQRGCNILISEAEKLKIEYGSAIADLVNESDFAPVRGVGERNSREISFKTIAEIIQARTLEIIDTVKFEIKKSGFKDSIAGITITGGGALLKDLTQLVEFRTGFETNIAKPNGYIFSTPDAFSNPKYATAIGLLQKGITLKEKEDIKKEQVEIIKQNTAPEKHQEINETPEDKDRKKPFKKIKDMLSNIFIEEDNSTEIN